MNHISKKDIFKNTRVLKCSSFEIREIDVTLDYDYIT